MSRICSLPLRAISSKNPRVQSSSPLFGPEATNESRFPKLGTQVVKRRYSTAYSSAVKFPPHPQDSFPTPQYSTLNGSLKPAAARSSAKVVLPAGELQYSIHR